MGATGSGKSSLLRLLSGAYNDFTGNIFINSIPLSNYQLQSLRMQTGILLSQQDIFQGTILENITMGDNEVSAQHILLLAQKIGLRKFMTDLSDGLNTTLDPIGKKLPKNIIQKILLLRALVNNPRLILLEDPLDGLSEPVKAAITNYLVNETPHQTILVSSNNEALAACCDIVIYLENASIKTIGTWEEVKQIIK
jgi:ABC-type bacteriocin/lantibiotic exporter with double-glycine peptidase domain